MSATIRTGDRLAAAGGESLSARCRSGPKNAADTEVPAASGSQYLWYCLRESVAAVRSTLPIHPVIGFALYIRVFVYRLRLLAFIVRQRSGHGHRRRVSAKSNSGQKPAGQGSAVQAVAEPLDILDRVADVGRPIELAAQQVDVLLHVTGRGAVAVRPEVGDDFVAGKYPSRLARQ